MEKIKILLIQFLLIFVSICADAQQWLTTNPGGTVPLYNQANIGINLPLASTPAWPLHVVGKTRFDIGQTTGSGNGRFYLTRTSNVNTECLLSFGTGPFGTATNTYDWVMGTYANATANNDFILNSWNAGRVITMLHSNGYVGIGYSVTNPIARLHVGGDVIASGNLGLGTTTIPGTRLHVNGDITFGSTVNKRKWRFATQNWLDYGKMYILPDDASGNADYTKAFNIDPRDEFSNFTFGHETGIFKTTIGRAWGITANAGTMYLGFNAIFNNSTATFDRSGNGTTANGGAVMWLGLDGNLSFSALQSSGTGAGANSASDVMDNKSMEIKRSSTGVPQVLIGKDDIGAGNVHQNDYSLAVDGKILAKEIYVTTQNWPDYVFKPDYNLMSLDDVKKYIDENSHLPEVPSAEEIEETGINSAEMDKLLLRKIEELTIHIIEQNKKIEELQNQVIRK